MKDRNENRPGYKKTKVGWIPEEWEIKTLYDNDVPAGLYKIIWNSRNDENSIVANGLYILRLKTDQGTKKRTCVLIK